METVSKFISGFVGGGAMSGLLLFVFRGQNQKIDAQDEKIAGMEEKKTDKDLCKILHKNLETSTAEIKEDLAGIHKDLTTVLIGMGQIQTALKGGIENNKVEICK
ncbi:MAG: hypothetical protein HOE02_05695 [Candidatus Marinimicrobia bacterium]|jgi:hypothetical protein|nr:hypothetical protein [Candidatus Neomarinimicrobiota bacterium]